MVKDGVLRTLLAKIYGKSILKILIRAGRDARTPSKKIFEKFGISDILLIN